MQQQGQPTIARVMRNQADDLQHSRPSCDIYDTMLCDACVCGRHPSCVSVRACVPACVCVRGCGWVRRPWVCQASRKLLCSTCACVRDVSIGATSEAEHKGKVI